MTTKKSRFLEYRIVIPGRAVSFRLAKAAEYKKLVAKLARVLIRKPPPLDAVEFRIDYFHFDRRKMDMDNIAKAVMDALSGIAYRDDQQVRDVSARAHSTADFLVIHGGPADLAKPLAQFSDYVFLRIRYLR